MNELDFWRTCCERGISICTIPRPMLEHVTCWHVVKHPTFKDRQHWTASHTFDSMEEVFRAVEEYFRSSAEPRARIN